MKKCICFALLLCLAASFAACKKTPAPEPDIVGGWSENRPVTDEDLAVFYEAMEDWVGVAYTPVLVSTQVVAGMNYRFTTDALGVYPGAEPYQAYVFIFKPLDGPPELVNIKTLIAD